MARRAGPSFGATIVSQYPEPSSWVVTIDRRHGTCAHRGGCAWHDPSTCGKLKPWGGHCLACRYCSSQAPCLYRNRDGFRPHRPAACGNLAVRRPAPPRRPTQSGHARPPRPPPSGGKSGDTRLVRGLSRPCGRSRCLPHRALNLARRLAVASPPASTTPLAMTPASMPPTSPRRRPHRGCRPAVRP